jgi:histone chaperone ASF1
MALVNIINVEVLDNPTSFLNPFQFEVTFECLQELSDDLEWKVIYVGSAEDAAQDQTLEEVMVGPVPVGINKFVLQAPAPDPKNIPNTDLVGVTVVLVTCSFIDHEFVRIGYYVNNEYVGEDVGEDGTLPNPIDIKKLRRNILAAEPRVTRFAIDWTGQSALPVEGDEGEEVMADDDEGMDLNEMEEEGEDEGSAEEEGEDNDDDIDLDAEDEGEAEGAQEDGITSPAGSVEMMGEDSNSMDVGMMQSSARLY